MIYAVDKLESKQRLALDIIRKARLSNVRLTLQALGEFFFVATRKGMVAGDIARAQVDRWVTMFGVPISNSPDVLTTAMQASEDRLFSFWDGMLLGAAEAAGCTAIISEDMAPGARLGRIRVVPAFAGDAVSPEALALMA